MNKHGEKVDKNQFVLQGTFPSAINFASVCYISYVYVCVCVCMCVCFWVCIRDVSKLLRIYHNLNVNLLTPNVNCSGRTAPLTSKVAFYIFIQLI